MVRSSRSRLSYVATAQSAFPGRKQLPFSREFFTKNLTGLQNSQWRPPRNSTPLAGAANAPSQLLATADRAPMRSACLHFYFRPGFVDLQICPGIGHGDQIWHSWACGVLFIGGFAEVHSPEVFHSAWGMPRFFDRRPTPRWYSDVDWHDHRLPQLFHELDFVHMIPSSAPMTQVRAWRR